MKTRWLLTFATLVVALWCAPAPATADNGDATLRMDVKLPINLDVTLETGGARAIVVAKLLDDKPDVQGQPWPCRLMHADPDKHSTDPFVLHVEPGALLVLVNLSDETVTFDFGGQLFVEPGTQFTLEPEDLKILATKQGLNIGPGDPGSVIRFAGTDCLDQLPGPVIYLP